MICYIITNESFPGWVKIGFTSKNDVTQRLRSYQTASPHRDFKVTHQVTFVDGKSAEKEVHDRLAAMGCKRKGEWFFCNDVIAGNIIDSVHNELCV